MPLQAIIQEYYKVYKVLLVCVKIQEYPIGNYSLFIERMGHERSGLLESTYEILINTWFQTRKSERWASFSEYQHALFDLRSDCQN